MFDIDMTLRNDTDEAVDVVIPKGSIFEGVSAPAGWPQQNLATTQEYRFTLDPYGRVTVRLQGTCINGPFPPPSNWPMRPTVFVKP
jgi:hypothetical protein